MCVELYFLANALADLSIFAAVARGLGCFRLRRVLAAATLAALCALLPCRWPGTSVLVASLTLLLLTSILLTGRSPIRLRLCAAALSATTALATGACGVLLNLRGLSVPLLLLPQLFSMGARLRSDLLSEKPTTVEITHQGETVQLSACVDTGNRLTEPFSGEPVLIASAELLNAILPDSGFRRVGYGSIGGAGTLPCFRPDRLYILRNGRRMPTPEVWIAVYPHRLPGRYQALAPSAFALY